MLNWWPWHWFSLLRDTPAVARTLNTTMMIVLLMFDVDIGDVQVQGFKFLFWLSMFFSESGVLVGRCAFNLHLGDTALACNHRLRDTRGQILEFLTRRRFSGRFSSPPGSTSHLGVRLVSNSMMEILNKVRSMVWCYSVCIASIIIKIVSLASRCGWRAAVWNNTATVTQTVITGRNFSWNAGSSSLQIQLHDGGRGLVLL